MGIIKVEKKGPYVMSIKQCSNSFHNDKLDVFPVGWWHLKSIEVTCSPSLFQVDLMRSFTFRNSKGSYRGIPIIAANMDTVGTFEMALALHQVSNAKSFKVVDLILMLLRNIYVCIHNSANLLFSPSSSLSSPLSISITPWMTGWSLQQSTQNAWRY